MAMARTFIQAPPEDIFDVLSNAQAYRHWVVGCQQIRDSDRFRHAREVVVHGWWQTDAERLVGLAESIGGPRGIFSEQAPEVGESLEALRVTAKRVLGKRSWPLLLCYRIRFGIK